MPGHLNLLQGRQTESYIPSGAACAAL